MSKESIFEILYYGGVSPCENSKLPQSGEYTSKLKKANELQEQLENLLNVDEKKLFDEFLCANSKIGSCFVQEKFIDGFILGARLVIETLTDTRFSDKEI